MEQQDYQSPGAIKMIDGRFQLQFDGPALWANLRRVLVATADGDPGTAIDSLLTGIGNFSKTGTLEHKAYSLLFSALHRACVAVLTNHPGAEQLLSQVNNIGLLSQDFYAHISQNVGAGQYAIEAAFFKEPQYHSLLKAVQGEYKIFLAEIIGLQTVQATVLAATLPDRFAVELADEWQRHDYSALIDHFKNNPFWPVLERQVQHKKRHARLLALFAKPAFQDARIALADMYIEPYFWVHRACVVDKKAEEFEPIDQERLERPFMKSKEDLLLHDVVHKWLLGQPALGLPSEKSPMLVLLGQPGQGKTSFCLRTADQLLREHPGTIQQLYLLRLRDVVNHSRLIEDPLPTLCTELDIPFDTGERELPKIALRNSLILLDGLDELYMSQGLKIEDINNFIRNLQKQLLRHEDLNCRVIVTSRTHYLKMEDMDGQKLPVLHLADLSVDQQKVWLERYRSHMPECSLTADLLEKIEKNEGKTYNSVRELVRQPILLHLIALSDVTLDGKTNTAHIYKELFQLMIRRKWDDKGQLDKYKNFKESDWLRFLRVLALSIFQSDHEYVRRKDFEKADTALHIEAERLHIKAEQSRLQLQDFVRDLLVSFYFQATERDNTERQRTDDVDHYAYEFLHKSLQEYLVADYIWDIFKTDMTERNKYGEYKISEASQALNTIAPLFEIKVITQEIADYLREIIKNDPDTETKKAVKQQCKKLMSGLLNLQFLKEHQLKSGDPGPLDKVAGNFYGFWSVASALIEEHVLPKPSSRDYLNMPLKKAIAVENYIPEAEKKIFVDLLILLHRRYHRKLSLYYQGLRGADLRGIDLHGADFRLEQTLRLVKFQLAQFRLVELRSVNVRFADLSGADLHAADFSFAKLRGLDLSFTDLSFTELRGADLRGADLSFTNLNGADLNGADLNGADLNGANLNGADLRRADLRRADLRRADFEGSKMDDVRNIEEAFNKESANFKGTIYENAPWANKE